MSRLALTFTALLLSPLLSGCCCNGGYSNYSGGYGDCLSYGDTYMGDGGCSGCGGDGFSLPPEGGSSYPMQQGMPYGTSYGPEVVGPEFVPNGTEWQTAPAVPGSNAPVTPAAPQNGTTGGPSALMPPSPIPAISTGNVVPPSTVYTTTPSTGPLMPPVPPPPPEPISQMRFRQYR